MAWQGAYIFVGRVIRWRKPTPVAWLHRHAGVVEIDLQFTTRSMVRNCLRRIPLSVAGIFESARNDTLRHDGVLSD